jgi:hypothetical protein
MRVLGADISEDVDGGRGLRQQAQVSIGEKRGELDKLDQALTGCRPPGQPKNPGAEGKKCAARG